MERIETPEGMDAREVSAPRPAFTSAADTTRGGGRPLRLALCSKGNAPAEVPVSFDGLLIQDALNAEGVAGLAASLDDLPADGSFIDLIIDRVATRGRIAADRPDLYPHPESSAALDPRHPFSETVAEARCDDGAAAERLGRFWGDALAARQVRGVRLRGLSTFSGGRARSILSAITDVAPAVAVVVETAGIPWEEIASWHDLGLAGVTCSLRWWDWRQSWFADELALLRNVAPVYASLEDQSPDAVRRCLALMVTEGLGWILPTDSGLNDLALLSDIADKVGGLGIPHHLSSPGHPVLAVLRGTTDDPRNSHDATLLLLNTRLDRAVSFDPATILPRVDGAFSPFAPLEGTDAAAEQHKLVPGQPVLLHPGALCTYRATRLHNGTPLPIDSQSAVRAGAWDRLALEAPSPAVDGGRFAVKRIVGETVEVEIDVIGDGHDKLAAALQWRGPGDESWHETRMRLIGNDRWRAVFPLETRGLHLYRVEAWRDLWATFRHELGAKHQAGVPTSLEIIEGSNLVRAAAERGDAGARRLLERLDGADEDRRREILVSEDAATLMAKADARPFSVRSDDIPVDAERTGAGFASWYEVFPRSMSDDVTRHGTFRDVERHLPRVRAMGFDVLYFPPIHPIGRTNRKGPNNTLTPGPEDVGSPYAVGTAEGGHDAFHPELGTLEDFLHLRQAAEQHGLELALDFAIQCSPDHPWLRDHKDWFDWRPDGSIRYAENPPKKYQDIVNVDFYAPGSVPDLWLALANVVLFWCEQGVRLFRVDNPHTKPFPFWQWMIAEVRARYPDAIFLAEAFTRPKVMNRLGKIGFSQSYTYFTWRNTKAELTEYLTQLTQEAPKDFFRPHFFVNTPDINPFFLQNTTRGAFLIRAAAAATLSGLWGVYNGFELCEGTPLAPGKEEYLDSEKFQLRAWDWNRPGNIVGEITRLNRIRTENPALQTHLGITFLPAANDAVLFFEKASPDRSNVLLVAISMDPHNTQSAGIELPLWKWGLPDQGTLAFEDLVGGNRFTLAGKYHSITLTPDMPYLIWRAEPAA